VETLLFYHPAVHRISRSLRQEREQCCDDIAAAVAGNRVAYARMLADLEQMRQATAGLALGIADQELLARVERLVRNATPTRPSAHWVPPLLLACALLMTATR